MDALTPAFAGRPDPAAGLDARLAAFGFSDPERRRALAARLASDATAAGADDIIGFAMGRLADWFGSLLGDRGVPPRLALAAGRAAFLAIGGAERWADCFLAPAPLPEAFVAALRRACPIPAPEPVPAVMAEQPLDLPIRLPAFRVWRSRTAEAA